MTGAVARRHGFGAAAVALLVLDALLRLAIGGPYAGSTVLLLAACGLSLVPLLPAELATPSRRLASLPALALASFTSLLTTLSIVGIPLTEASVRAASAGLVVAALAGAVAAEARREGERPRWSPRQEVLVGAALLAIVSFALAASWDVADPVEIEGTDVGHYLLYADQVKAQEGLLIEDPFAGEEGRLFADPAAVGAVYGSFLVLDGISSWTLSAGIVVVSALTVLSVFAAAAGLWGSAPGLVAAGVYAVAPIRLDPMYWHGLGTTLALVFLPLAVLAIGLMYRGSRDSRVVGLLAVSLVGVAAAHSTTAIVAAVFVAFAPLVDLVRALVLRWGRPADAIHWWWHDGIVRPLLGGVGVAFVLGAGVVAHLAGQAASLGRPVHYRFLGPDWLDRAAIGGYFSWQFLAVAAVAAVLVLTGRQRRDSALLALAALALACIVVSQLWRVHVPFEYRRVVYYLGTVLVLVIGLAFLRFRTRLVWVGASVLVVAYLAHHAVGLRLPQRLVTSSEPESATHAALRLFRDRLDRGDLPDTRLIVTDSCLPFAVPYVVERPTIAAFTERQVGFADRLRLARRAARVLDGGPAGRALAERLGVGYVVVRPGCEPDVETRLGGEVVLENEAVLVLRPATPASRDRPSTRDGRRSAASGRAGGDGVAARAAGR